jgi:hypothetical protein
MLISPQSPTVAFDRDREQPALSTSFVSSRSVRVRDVAEEDRISAGTSLEITIPFPEFEFLSIGVGVTLVGSRKEVTDEVLVGHADALVFYVLSLERASILRGKPEVQELPVMPPAVMGTLRLVYGRTFKGAESQLAGGRSEYLKPQVTSERSFGPSNVEFLQAYRELEVRLTQRLRDLSSRASTLPR